MISGSRMISSRIDDDGRELLACRHLSLAGPVGDADGDTDRATKIEKTRTAEPS